MKPFRDIWGAGQEKQAHTHLDVMALHVACGISEEAIHDEALRIDAVDQGKSSLQIHETGKTLAVTWKKASSKDKLGRTAPSGSQ